MYRGAIHTPPSMSFASDHTARAPDAFWGEDPNVLLQTAEIFPTRGMSPGRQFNAATRLVVVLTAAMYFFLRRSAHVIIVGALSVVGIYLVWYKRLEMEEGFASPTSPADDAPDASSCEAEACGKGSVRTSEWLRENGQSTLELLPYQDPETADERAAVDQPAVTEGEGEAALTAAERKMYQMPSTTNPFGNILLTDAPDRRPAPPAFIPEVRDQISRKTKEMVAEMRGESVERLFGNVDDALAFEQSQRQFYTTAVTTTPSDMRTFVEYCYGNPGAFRDSINQT